MKILARPTSSNTVNDYCIKSDDLVDIDKTNLTWLTYTWLTKTSLTCIDKFDLIDIDKLDQVRLTQIDKCDGNLQNAVKQ